MRALAFLTWSSGVTVFPGVIAAISPSSQIPMHALPARYQGAAVPEV